MTQTLSSLRTQIQTNELDALFSTIQHTAGEDQQAAIREYATEFVRKNASFFMDVEHDRYTIRFSDGEMWFVFLFNVAEHELAISASRWWAPHKGFAINPHPHPNLWPTTLEPEFDSWLDHLYEIGDTEGFNKLLRQCVQTEIEENYADYSAEWERWTVGMVKYHFGV